MRSQSSPRVRLSRLLDAVPKSKLRPRGPRLKLLKPYLRLRFYEYLRQRRSLEDLAKEGFLSPKQKEALLHCYEHPTAPLKEARRAVAKQRSKAERRLCPYCLLRQPRTLDHFLPKADFPEFAFLPQNLVLVCGVCNEIKGSRLVSPPRSVLSPYFDRISIDAPLLYCKVSIVGGVPALSFFVPDDENSYVADVFRRHLISFDLARTYASEGAEFVGSLLREVCFRYSRRLTEEELSLEIDARRRSLSGYGGGNAWEEALLFGIEECGDFLAYVNGEISSGKWAQSGPAYARRRGVAV